MMTYETERERITAAEHWAEEQMKAMPEAVAEYGAAGVMSDLMHEYLMHSAPSRELLENVDDLDKEDD